MDNRKFEQLIDLIINEDEDKARALFHDIVVEKSREIYESMMYSENDHDMGGVGELMDEIGAEEHGFTEEDDEFADIEVDDEDDMDDSFGDEEDEEEDLEDRVVDLEDKLDQLMSEFEELMGHEEGEEDFGGEENFGDEEMMEAKHKDDEEDDEEEDEEEDMTESLEEAIQLKKIPGLYDSKIGGDDGDNTKSVALSKPKVTQTGAKAVNFSGESSTGGTKGGLLSPDTKDVKGAGSFKNSPGQAKAKTETAPKPQHGKGGDGQNNKSIVGESKKSVKKIIKK
jgi:hypothetical protein